jgi:hypothetical protein
VQFRRNFHTTIASSSTSRLKAYRRLKPTKDMKKALNSNTVQKAFKRLASNLKWA